jgi:hypothetical protein
VKSSFARLTKGLLTATTDIGQKLALLLAALDGCIGIHFSASDFFIEFLLDIRVVR